VFLAATGSLLSAARAAILARLARQRFEAEAIHPLMGAAVGVTASTATVLLMFLGRYGLYYEPLLWILLGATAAIPSILAPRTHAT
jgi:predicted membrane protein